MLDRISQLRKLDLITGSRYLFTLKKLERMFGDKDLCIYSKNFDYSKKVLVYDITGDLFQLYNYADVCIVGRGFHRLEIHNMLEPAVFFKPVLIGPKHKKFIEPKLFIKKQRRKL